MSERQPIDNYFDVFKGHRRMRTSVDPTTESSIKVLINDGEWASQLTLDGDEELFSISTIASDILPEPLKKKDRTLKSIQHEVLVFQSERRTMKQHDRPIGIIEKTEKELDELFAESVDFPTPEQKEKIASELADCFIYLLVYSNFYGIEADKAIVDKVAINRERFPVSLWNGPMDWWDAYIESKKRAGEFDPQKHRRPVATSPAYEDII